MQRLAVSIINIAQRAVRIHNSIHIRINLFVSVIVKVQGMRLNPFPV